MGSIIRGDMGRTVDIFLDHHGVKGQKWGIRNEKKPIGHTKNASIQVDEKPWSNYKESDYSPQQWHTACLIHNHTGTPTAKSQCKLPIKTPTGVVNRHGVFAAAAVLAGSRGGVQASSEQKNSAATSLLHIYQRIGATPPPSLLLKHSSIEEYLTHYGKKGMHWGIHTEKDFFRTGSKNGSKSAHKTQYQKSSKRLSDDELNRRIKRMELEKRYTELKAPTKSAGKKYAHDLLQNTGRTIVGTVVGSVVTFAIGRMLKKRFGG